MRGRLASSLRFICSRLQPVTWTTASHRKFRTTFSSAPPLPAEPAETTAVSSLPCFFVHFYQVFKCLFDSQPMLSEKAQQQQIMLSNNPDPNSDKTHLAVPAITRQCLADSLICCRIGSLLSLGVSYAAGAYQLRMLQAGTLSSALLTASHERTCKWAKSVCKELAHQHEPAEHALPTDCPAHDHWP